MKKMLEKCGFFSCTDKAHPSVWERECIIRRVEEMVKMQISFPQDAVDLTAVIRYLSFLLHVAEDRYRQVAKIGN